MGLIFIRNGKTCRHKNDDHKEVSTHISVEAGGTEHLAVPHGEGPGLVGRHRGPGNSMAQSLYWGFRRKEWARQSGYTE